MSIGDYSRLLYIFLNLAKCQSIFRDKNIWKMKNCLFLGDGRGDDIALPSRHVNLMPRLPASLACNGHR